MSDYVNTPLCKYLLAHSPVTWNAFDGDLPDTLAIAGQARMHFPDLSLLPLDQLLQDLLLFPDDGAELGVHDLGVQLAPHQGGALVVFDVALEPNVTIIVIFSPEKRKYGF